MANMSMQFLCNMTFTPEDVDVHAQEVADAQATANVNLVAGDDDDAVAPLDADGPT
ncbi:hypothetical protein AeRB84_020988, partial [Aphanomyces euteiches]